MWGGILVPHCVDHPVPVARQHRPFFLLLSRTGTCRTPNDIRLRCASSRLCSNCRFRGLRSVCRHTSTHGWFRYWPAYAWAIKRLLNTIEGPPLAAVPATGSIPEIPRQIRGQMTDIQTRLCAGQQNFRLCLVGKTVKGSVPPLDFSPPNCILFYLSWSSLVCRVFLSHPNLFLCLGFVQNFTVFWHQNFQRKVSPKFLQVFRSSFSLSPRPYSSLSVVVRLAPFRTAALLLVLPTRGPRNLLPKVQPPGHNPWSQTW